MGRLALIDSHGLGGTDTHGRRELDRRSAEVDPPIRTAQRHRAGSSKVRFWRIITHRRQAVWRSSAQLQLSTSVSVRANA